MDSRLSTNLFGQNTMQSEHVLQEGIYWAYTFAFVSYLAEVDLEF
jgi:hypothetical protein